MVENDLKISDYKNKLLYICAKLAHDTNLNFGSIVKQVVDDRCWLELSVKEGREKLNTFSKIANLTEFKYEGGHQGRLNAPYLHYLWLKTVTKDHLCNKPWEELTTEQKFKDELYLSFINLYKHLRGK